LLSFKSSLFFVYDLSSIIWCRCGGFCVYISIAIIYSIIRANVGVVSFVIHLHYCIPNKYI
jgi:hypothetical protein